MTWFRVDDNFAFHPKVVASGNTAIGLWVRAGAWSMQNLTDGYVPEQVVRALCEGGENRNWKRLPAKLVASGLWTEVKGGWRFHEFNDRGRQPTREDVETARRDAAARQARHRDKSRQQSQRDEGVTNAVSHTTPTRPDPYMAEVVDQRPVAVGARNDAGTAKPARPSSGFAADIDRQLGIEAIMRKLRCDEAWAERTARRFDALAAKPINDHAAFYGTCLSEHIAKQGLDSLLPTPIPKAPLLCEHGVPMNARCPDCEGTASY